MPSRFAGCTTVADLGCGLGAESLAFLRAGLGVRAVELDPLTAQFAGHNLRVAATRSSETPALLRATTCSQATRPCSAAATLTAYSSTQPDAPLATATPGLDRRPTTRPHSISPLAAASSVRAGGVKLGPGLDRELIPEDAEAQWVSVDGQLVEMGLWFGDAARPRFAALQQSFARRGRRGTQPSQVHELLARSGLPRR